MKGCGCELKFKALTMHPYAALASDVVLNCQYCRLDEAVALIRDHIIILKSFVTFTDEVREAEAFLAKLSEGGEG